MSSLSSYVSPEFGESYVPLSKRTGKLAFTLTNDYIFKAVLQRDESILRALLCSLLSIHEKEILSVRIMNPIHHGTTISDKETFLDVKLLLNSSKIINLEMQVKRQNNWTERSLVYLCRTFDNAGSGKDYAKVIPAHQISILSFSLPELKKEFYSHYYISNEKTHERFSDKFRLSVLDLTQAELATEHDRQFGLDLWAAAFNAATWEDFKMLSEKDPLYQKVAEAVYIVSCNRMLADEIRQANELRAMRERRDAEYAAQKITIAEQNAEIESLRAENARLKSQHNT